MTTEELAVLFELFRDDYIKFDRVTNKKSTCPDVHGFLLLESLAPSEDHADMVSAAQHDEFFLRVEPSDVAANATKAQVLDLVRCGIRYDTSEDCFCMFT